MDETRPTFASVRSITGLVEEELDPVRTARPFGARGQARHGNDRGPAGRSVPTVPGHAGTTTTLQRALSVRLSRRRCPRRLPGAVGTNFRRTLGRSRGAPGPGAKGRPSELDQAPPRRRPYDLTLDKGQAAHTRPSHGDSREPPDRRDPGDYVVVDPVPVERRVEPEELRTAVDEASGKGASTWPALRRYPAGGRGHPGQRCPLEGRSILSSVRVPGPALPDERSVAPADLASSPRTGGKPAGPGSARPRHRPGPRRGGALAC